MVTAQKKTSPSKSLIDTLRSWVGQRNRSILSINKQLRTKPIPLNYVRLSGIFVFFFFDSSKYFACLWNSCSSCKKKHVHRFSLGGIFPNKSCSISVIRAKPNKLPVMVLLIFLGVLDVLYCMCVRAHT